MAAGSGQGSVPSGGRVSMVTCAFPPGGTTVRAWVIRRAACSLLSLPTGRYSTHFEGRDPPVSSSGSPAPSNRLGTLQADSKDL